MNSNGYSVEEIKDIFIQTCEELYGPMDHNSYFHIKDKSEQEVINEILSTVNDKSFAKLTYLDMSLYVLQTGEDVFIRV